MVHDNVIFVLVRPQFLGNIGAAARVLKNFSFGGLALVEPPRNYKDSEARRMAVGAFDVLKNAPVFSTVSEALADVSLAVGTSSGQQRGEMPERLQAVLPRLLEVAEANKVAFLFGDERNGLSRQDLQRCHHTVTIPVNPQFPALNMAQAVGIIAYEMSLERDTGKAGSPGKRFPCGTQDDELFRQIGDLLEEIQFSRTFNKESVLREMRSAYQRFNPSCRELDLLKGVLHRINQRLKGGT